MFCMQRRTSSMAQARAERRKTAGLQSDGADILELSTEISKRRDYRAGVPGGAYPTRFRTAWASAVAINCKNSSHSRRFGQYRSIAIECTTGVYPISGAANATRTR